MQLLITCAFDCCQDDNYGNSRPRFLGLNFSNFLAIANLFDDSPTALHSLLESQNQPPNVQVYSLQRHTEKMIISKAITMQAPRKFHYHFQATLIICHP